MRRQAEFAGMRRQRPFLARGMLDGMRPRRQLGEAEDNNEKEMAQRIHEGSLIDLDEQAFEIFAFRKVQRDRVVGRTGQTAHDACLASSVVGSAGNDLLEQLEPDTA